MRKSVSMLFLGVVFFALPLAGNAEDFSADVLQKMKNHGAQGKIFISGEKTRMETPEATTIIRVDKNVMWVLMPAQGIYMEQPIGANNIVVAKEKMPGEIKRTHMGQELLDGKMTDKYRITYSQNGNTSTIYQWFANSVPIPVKTMTEDGSWMMEYKNIKIGKQPDSLFELPSGYKKFSYDVNAPENALEMMGEENQGTSE